MGRSIWFVLLVIFSFGVFGQTEPRTEQPKTSVHLKDGSIFHGHKIDESGYHIELIIVTGDTLILQKDLVVGISDHDHTHTRRKYLYRKKARFHYKDGFYVYLTGMLGRGANDSFTGVTDITVGYRINPNRSVGIGAGLATSDIFLGSSWLFHEFATVFLYGRQYLGKSRTRFYFDARVGYGFPRVSQNLAGNEHNGGLHFQPGVGLHFATRFGLKWHVGVSQYIQRTSGEDVSFGPFNQPIETDFKIWYSRPVFKVAIEIW